MTTINLSEYPKLPFSCITRLYFVLYAVAALHLSRVLYKSTLFMQNKPNFQKAQMNTSSVLTKDYGNWTLGERGKNKPNTNPIQSQYKPNSNPIKAKTNPIQTQFKPKQTQFQAHRPIRITLILFCFAPILKRFL